MKILIIALAIVQLALCVDEDKLPTAASLIEGAERSCEDFIASRANAECCEYETKSGKKEVFYQLFEADPATGISFDDAQASCNMKGGFLATFTDVDQFNKVRDATFPDLAAGETKDILLGIMYDDGTYKNQDMIKNAVPAELQPVHETGMDCVVARIDGDAAADGSDTVEIVVTDCAETATTTNFMCRFNYLSNSIVYVNEYENWNSAMSKCQEIGGELLSLKNNEERRAVNCLLDERAKHGGWIGLNDLNEEGHFSWSDYSIAKFTPFCKKPEEDFERDCVFLQANHVEPDDKDQEHGCLKVEKCDTQLPYVCKIRDPDADEHSLLFKEYLVHLLKDVVAAEGVCSGTCGNGLGSIFGHKTTSGVIPRKRVKVVRRKPGQRKTKKILRSRKKITPKDKKSSSSLSHLQKFLSGGN